MVRYIPMIGSPGWFPADKAREMLAIEDKKYLDWGRRAGLPMPRIEYPR